MKAPKRLRFGGTEYKVLYLPQVMEGRDKHLQGTCDYKKTLIQVSTDQSMEAMKSTTLHESIHAAAFQMDWEAKEATVLKMEKLFWSLLRDNPHLIKWLLETDDAAELQERVRSLSRDGAIEERPRPAEQSPAHDDKGGQGS